jgi:hypothetical protein
MKHYRPVPGSYWEETPYFTFSGKYALCGHYFRGPEEVANSMEEVDCPHCKDGREPILPQVN